jgi:hypothetical protein
MKIERRNISDLESIAAFPVFILILVLCANYSTLSNLLTLFLIFGFIIFVYFFKVRNLKSAEIEFLEKESELLIEHEKNDYFSGLSFIGTLIIYIPLVFEEHPKFVYFGLVPVIFIGVIAFYFQYKNGYFINVEKLIFTPTQLILLREVHTVVDIENIDEIILWKSKVIVREKYGEIEWETEKMDSTKRNLTNNKLREIALQHSIKLDERNLIK